MSEKSTVDEAWNAVMCSVRSVAKGDYNQAQGFRFRGVDAVVEATGPALREHGVSVIPKEIRDINRVDYETSKGTRMTNTVVTVMWEVRGPDGDYFTGESVGEAADSGDKSISKAQSVAYRVFLLQALNIPTGEPDPDTYSHERNTRATTEASRRSGDVATRQGGGDGGDDPVPNTHTARAANQDALDELASVCRIHSFSEQGVAKRFKEEHPWGVSIQSANPDEIRLFGEKLIGEATA